MASTIDETKISEVKSRVSIPNYFDKVIIPELPGYYSDYTVNFENRPVVKCPIHGEDTPSLRWYEDTNTFYCFGCRAGGDVINLHRLFMNNVSGTMPSFEESVDYLYNAFIKGDELQDIKGITKANSFDTSNEPKSSNIEMLRLMNYLTGLEKTLLIENNIPKKNKIFNIIDTINILCALNLINATDGMNYIKQEVRNIGNE